MPSAHLPGPAIDGIHRLLRRFATDISVDHASVWITGDDGGLVLSSTGIMKNGSGPEHALVAERSGPVIVNDIDREPLISLATPEVRAALGLPLTDAANHLVGALAATSIAPRKWSNTDIERAGDMAATLNGFVAMARLLQRVAERSAHQTEVRLLRSQMHLIASTAASATTVEEIADVLAAEAAPLLGAEAVAVALPDDERRFTWRPDHDLHEGFAEAVDAVVQSDALSEAADATGTEGVEVPFLSIWPNNEVPQQQRSLLVLPMRTDNGNTVAILAALRNHQRRDSLDLAMAQELAHDAARAMQRAADARRMAQAARTLQESLLPPKSPQVDGLEIGRLYSPAARHTAIGGDWYDMIPVSDGISGFVVGDVAGHDMRSAAVMGQVRHVLASQLRDRSLPSEALTATDRYFAGLAENMMATVAVFTIDGSGHVQVSLAGHPPPIHVSSVGAVIVSARPGAPLGLGYGGYRDYRLQLGLGETLVAYTDGVVERRDGNIREHIEGLAASLAKADTSVKDLLHTLRTSSKQTGSVDDAAALVVRRVQS